MMRAMEAPLSEIPEFAELLTYMEKPFACAEVSGCSGSQKFHVMAGLSQGSRYRLIITYSDQRAREIAEEYQFYDRNVIIYPAKDLIFYQADTHSNDIVRERMRALRRLSEGKSVTVITTFAGLMTPQIPMQTLKKNILDMDKRTRIQEHALAARLVEMGYEKTFQVEAPGQFSVRGGIVDVFDLTEDNPYRIELFDDEIESLRSFDISSQRSLEKLESLSIYPATEMLFSHKEIKEGVKKIQKDGDAAYESLRKEFKTEEAHRIKSEVKEVSEQILEFHQTQKMEGYFRYFQEEETTFLDLFEPGMTCIFIDEPGRSWEQGNGVEMEFRESMIHRAEKGYALPGQMDLLRSCQQVVAGMGSTRRVLVDTLQLPLEKNPFTPEKQILLETSGIAPYNSSFEALVKDLKKYRKDRYRVLLLSGSRTRAKRLVQNLKDLDVPAFYSEDPGKTLEEGEVMAYYGHIRGGFAYPTIKFAVIAESDIFTEHKKKKKKKKKFTGGEKIGNFAELKVGDYVVHEDHGLGIYRGIEKIAVDHVFKDYMKIEYAGGSNLYVQATALDVIQKYASGGDDEHVRKPKLNKLGAPEWNRTKSRVKSAVAEVAQDLVELYAKRQEANGFSYSKDTVWQQEFEDAFPYEPTEDQENAIEATKADMESNKIMDRLICGDVGFGKTEIAIRAAFKAVQDGKQVAVLVPTTILAQQHYNTFTERMKDFPVRIDLMSRFRTTAEQKATLTDLRKGMVDIVIGTHRLLSQDVKYKDLGLLIVDEEQRFGVTHKEKIKKLKENIDVLTLTATPIPRTLHMSLVGIRDMSVLEEAPNERIPIRTFVCEYNDEMVREAIVRELNRGGQVYYVYNRVNNIADIAAQIQKLVPEANVAFAHGQMREHELEKIMYDFISGDIDVLISTTIIETGLDIPNVNTMIIHSAEQMGLSQLYQLRGRVGRSNRTAYAFLMYKKDKMLSEIAEKRLSAIREFTDLGSGFKIAMRDLEIRGAGSVLGEAQSGHMEAVGYDLYCKMLSEAVAKLKTDGKMEENTEYTTLIDLDVDAFLPTEYILNEEQKLEIYKRIAVIENQGECDDMRDEMMDRFGKLPEQAENLLAIAMLRNRAHALYITEVKGGHGEITFEFHPQGKVDPAGIMQLVKRSKGKITLRTKGAPLLIYKYGNNVGDKTAPQKLMQDTDMLLTAMEAVLPLKS